MTVSTITLICKYFNMSNPEVNSLLRKVVVRIDAEGVSPMGMGLGQIVQRIQPPMPKT